MICHSLHRPCAHKTLAAEDSGRSGVAEVSPMPAFSHASHLYSEGCVGALTHTIPGALGAAKGPCR